MPTTAWVFPTASATFVYNDTGGGGGNYNANDWTTPGGITADDTTYASITAATYDSPDYSYVLAGTTFDFSSIMAGSTINGIRVSVGANYISGQGTGSLVFVGLFATTTLLAANRTVSALTTTIAEYIRGGTADNWGGITLAQLQASTFRVGVAIQATAANADVQVDWIKVEVTYTEPAPQNFSQNPTDSATATDVASVSFSPGTVSETASAADFISFLVSALLTDAASAADSPTLDLVVPVAGIVYRSVKGSYLTAEELDGNLTLLNSRKLERTGASVTSSAAVTPTGVLQYDVTALAVDSAIGAPSGTFSDGQQLVLRIRDDGSARSLSWDAVWRPIGFLMPSATTPGESLYLLAVYNSADSAWDVLGCTV